jgi:hypothetical protein
VGTNIKFILAKEIVSKERDRRREKRVKEDKRNFEENKKKEYAENRMKFITEKTLIPPFFRKSLITLTAN